MPAAFWRELIGRLGHRHHYVPRFYLRRFASRLKRINVYNLSRRRLIAHAGLRDQCYRRRFYGRQDVEDDLARLENRAAPAIAELIDADEAPRPGSALHRTIVEFSALQWLRTAATLDRTDRSLSGMMDAVFRENDELRPPDLSHNELLMMSLAQLPEVARSLADLELGIVSTTREAPFITSDQPVVRYNSLCEGVTWVGVGGAASLGLQVFVPLSPTRLAILYDGTVYKMAGRRSHKVARVSERDSSMLNLLQTVWAAENLYATSGTEAMFKKLHARATRHRSNMAPVTTESEDEGDPLSGLVHMYVPQPQLGLRLTFISLRRYARRLSPSERIHKRRNTEITRSNAPARGMGAESRRFVVRRTDVH